VLESGRKELEHPLARQGIPQPSVEGMRSDALFAGVHGDPEAPPHLGLTLECLHECRPDASTLVTFVNYERDQHGERTISLEDVDEVHSTHADHHSALLGDENVRRRIGADPAQAPSKSLQICRVAELAE
jgi:hypothetical protein